MTLRHNAKVDTAENFGSIENSEQNEDLPHCPIGVSKEIVQIWEEAQNLKDSGLPMLIQGETGVGKEVFARFLHSTGKRKDKQFIAVNCSAMPKELMESELFGVEKNAATGVDFRRGKIEMADQGILLLDEIGDMPLNLQSKLLRIFEQGSFFRVGGNKQVQADVCFMAATNSNLMKRVEEGDFRNDLYFRLKGATFLLPPLRERKADIPWFLEYFLNDLNARNTTSVVFSRRAHQSLLKYPWPGNIRELKNEVTRAYHLAKTSGLIQTFHFSAAIKEAENPLGLFEEVSKFEKMLIERALEAHESAVEAAKALSIPRSTLYNKIRLYKIKIKEK